MYLTTLAIANMILQQTLSYLSILQPLNMAAKMVSGD